MPSPDIQNRTFSDISNISETTPCKRPKRGGFTGADTPFCLDGLAKEGVGAFRFLLIPWRRYAWHREWVARSLSLESQAYQ